MNKNINALISKELSRKEFLKFVGGGVVVMLGMNNFISYLSQFNNAKPQTALDNSHGFGSRKFGG